ncbi:hypothetical protein J6590_077724 [Homalodisca vitripennis]|nr:hypothetical protein J6590_077722 [Homalodisca vitripennis]KAG8335045.1 hypothetical protein J6590_077724 [Homalodisca vitripennis]
MPPLYGVEDCTINVVMGVPMNELSKTLDFESEVEIARVLKDRLSFLFCLMRSSHRPVAHEDGQNKAQKAIGLSLK